MIVTFGNILFIMLVIGIVMLILEEIKNNG
nr:MAG TPA: hypothetical protein [Inoviridae sp.]